MPPSDIWSPKETYPDSSSLSCHRPRSSSVPALSDPVPSDWTVIEDSFQLVYAVNTAYIGTEVKFAPNAWSDDGRMWLIIVKKGVSRLGEYCTYSV
jgi:hypothetical protein